MRYALAQRDCTHVWLLNADTLVTPDSLSELLAALDKHPGIGMCGSTLLYYAAPSRIHALGGGRYSKWFALTRLAGKRRRCSENIKRHAASRPLSMVSGASMLVTKELLRAVGLMCEDCFLYFEELDWAARAAGRFSLTYAPKSVVYHKGDLGKGAAPQLHGGNLQARYFHTRSRLIFTRKYHPNAMTTVRLAMVAEALARLALGQLRVAKMMLILAVGPVSAPGAPPASRMENPVG